MKRITSSTSLKGLFVDSEEICVDPYTLFVEKDLRSISLIGCTINGTISFTRSNLSYSSFIGSDLSFCDFSWANLSYVKFIGTNLSNANLSWADLTGADFSNCNLRNARMERADFSSACLKDAVMLGVNLSGSTGLLKPIEWLLANFKSDEKGIYVYKMFGAYFTKPKEWNIYPLSVIEEEVNYNRTEECGCGINFATIDWIKKNTVTHATNRMSVYKCLISWGDVSSIVVPYNTDGKARCGRLQILEEVTSFDEFKQDQPLIQRVNLNI